MTSQYLLCREDENWVVFGMVEMSDDEADALVIVLNDQFAETGHRVKRLCAVSSNEESVTRIRRLQRDWEFWLGTISRSQEGLDSSVNEDYPVHFECWSALDEAVAYIREMSKAGTIRFPMRESELKQGAGTPADWWFLDDPEPDSRFKFGPVFCSLKSAAKAFGHDERTLKNNNGKSYVWIRRRSSREYAFWFEYEAEYLRVRHAIGSEE